METDRLALAVLLAAAAAGCGAPDSGLRSLPRIAVASQQAMHAPGNPAPRPEAAGAIWTPLGLQVREVPQAALKALGVSAGVMVTSVRSPADRSRILPGDVIVGVNQTPVRSLEEFSQLVSEQPAGTVGLLVRRADADLYIALDTGPGNASRGAGNPPLPDESFRRRRSPTDTPLRT
jgi:membrane-associated protease RseP (regulator of RpoE activity)